jgi:hypothetical protein
MVRQISFAPVKDRRAVPASVMPPIMVRSDNMAPKECRLVALRTDRLSKGRQRRDRNRRCHQRNPHATPHVVAPPFGCLATTTVGSAHDSAALLSIDQAIVARHWNPIAVVTIVLLRANTVVAAAPKGQARAGFNRCLPSLGSNQAVTSLKCRLLLGPILRTDIASRWILQRSLYR